MKSEPAVFSFDDLLRAPNRTTYWDGVRNFAARNFLRDGMKLGDRVFFYHSMADPQVIAGVCEVVREGYPDFTATRPRSIRTSTRGRIRTHRPGSWWTCARSSSSRGR